MHIQRRPNAVVIVVGLTLGLLLIVLPVQDVCRARNLDKLVLDACKTNDAEKVQSILSNGANVNSRDQDGRTALIVASLFGNPETVKVKILIFLPNGQFDQELKHPMR